MLDAIRRRAQYLLDFGYTPEILNRNFDLLNIGPGAINGLILGHDDRAHQIGVVMKLTALGRRPPW